MPTVKGEWTQENIRKEKRKVENVDETKKKSGLESPDQHLVFNRPSGNWYYATPTIRQELEAIQDKGGKFQEALHGESQSHGEVVVPHVLSDSEGKEESKRGKLKFSQK